MNNTATKERLNSERAFHDNIASRVKVTPGRGGWVDCETPTWPNEPKISPSLTTRLLRILGEFSGKRVLIYGCGYDPGATWFAKRGAMVTAIDISPESINDQQILMEAYGVSMDLKVADAMHTSFPDESFDLIYGNAILHHLDSDQCSKELCRLLAPGGVAVFREVQAGNVFLRAFRYLTPFWRTPDEHPLTEKDYAIYTHYFKEVKITAHVFTSMLYLFIHRVVVTALRLVRVRWWPPENASILALCDRIDSLLIKVPGFKSQMWFSLIEMRRQPTITEH